MEAEEGGAGSGRSVRSAGANRQLSGPVAERSRGVGGGGGGGVRARSPELEAMR